MTFSVPAASSAAEVSPASVAPSVAALPIVDDFEAGVPAEWFQYGDYGSGTNISYTTPATDTVPGLTSNHVLSITYNSAGWGAGLGKNLAPDNWSAYDGLSFWFKGMNSGATFRMVLSENKSDPSADTAERFAYEFVDNSAGWRYISIPWGAFFRDGWQPDGAPDDGFTLTEMWAYALVLPIDTSGTVYMDQVRLFKLANVDDFETGVPSTWFQYGDYGSGTSISYTTPATDTVPGLTSNHVLSTTYNSAGWGAGMGRNLTPDDWSAYDGLSFWFKGMNSGATFRVVLSENKSDPSADTAERFAYEFVDNSAGWRHISIPWGAFFRDGWQPDGAPDDGFTLTEMWAYALVLPIDTNGTVYVDQVSLFGSLVEAPRPTADFDQAIYLVNEDVGEAIITAKLDMPATGPITVSYHTADDGALAGSDYTAVSGDLVFQPGQTTITFTVPIIDNNIYEASENVTLFLEEAQKPGTITIIIGGRNNPAKLVILDDETPPDTKLIDNFESDLFMVRNTFNTDIGFVRWGSNDADKPVLTTTQIVTAVPGMTVSNTVLSIAYDITAWGGLTHNFEDQGEWVTQDWSAYDGFRFWLYGNNTGGQIQVEIFDNQSLGSTGDNAERWYYRITDNYNGWKQFHLPFAAFQRRTDWQPGDAPKDGFNLTEVSGYAFGLPAGTGAQTAYLDQVEIYGEREAGDMPLRVNFSTYAYAVTEGQTAQVRVMLNTTSTQEVSVQYVMTEDTALADEDYVPGTGTLTFAPGTTVQTITVQTINDPGMEKEEELMLALFNPTNATLGQKATAPLFIRDNDVPDAGLIDDFDSLMGIKTSGGVTATVTQVMSGTVRQPQAVLVDPVPGQWKENNILSVTYALPSMTGSLTHMLPMGRDSSTYDSMGFWFYGMNTGTTMTLTLLDNRAPDPGPSGWDLVWSDEFEGAAGAAPDPTKWGYDIGGKGWGNRELQYYTDKRENSALDGDGHLVITATESTTTTYECNHTLPDYEPGTCGYTSARLLTQDKYEFAYGRAEARIQVPFGQGIWPAFWSLGANFDDVDWPNCGEIDIMENIGKEPNTVHGTVHGPGYSGGSGIGGGHTLTEALANDYHVYAIEWEPEEIRWYIDDTQYFTVTPSMLPEGTEWVFDHPFFLIMNVAVGGYWPGYPDDTTQFPQTMHVDYVRVYQGPDTSERFETTFNDSFTGWKQLTLPYEDFTRSATQPTNAPDDGLTLSEVWGYGFSMPSGSNGGFYLDDVRFKTIPTYTLYLPVVTRRN